MYVECNKENNFYRSQAAKYSKNHTQSYPVENDLSMIKRPLTPGQKRLRVEWSRKYTTMGMKTDLPLGFHSQMQVI